MHCADDTAMPERGVYELQLIAWSRLNTSFQVKPPGADNQTPEGKAESATAERGAKLTWTHPLMYAVELGQPAWLQPMAESAQAYFLLDAAKVNGGQLDISYTEAAAQRKFSVAAKASAALRLSDWVNAPKPGPENGPTALYRSELLLSHSALPSTTLVRSVMKVECMCA